MFSLSEGIDSFSEIAVHNSCFGGIGSPLDFTVLGEQPCIREAGAVRAFAMRRIRRAGGPLIPRGPNAIENCGRRKAL